MEENFKFIVQKVDFWQILTSDTSWSILGIIAYITIAYKDVILTSNVFKVLWKNRSLCGYGLVLSMIIAVVYRSFPDMQEFIVSLPFYNDFLGAMGFVGVGVATMKFASGKNKDNMINDIFTKKTGFDPNKEA